MQSTGKAFRVLIVDDSETMRAQLTALLEPDYELDLAADGREALSLLVSRGHQYALMVLGTERLTGDSLRLLTDMKQHRWIEEVPVILLTGGQTTSEEVQQAYALGVTDFIQRPCDDAIARQRIRNTIRLGAKQQKLAGAVAEQFYEKEKTAGLMVSILSGVVEYRNGESGPHILHIKNMTRRLLEQLLKKTDRYQIALADIPMICNAAAFHDIGKIAIPDHILNKPGRLTPEEFAIMKTHSAIGAQLLTRMTRYKDEPLVQMTYSICRWHHERWDGHGYPDGLVGDQIPIETQVVSLADVYDALTSERCYKRAYTHEEAMKMILGGECGAFNPLLLECLQDLGEELRELGDIEKESPFDRIRDVLDDIGSRDELSKSRNIVQQLAVNHAKLDFLLDHIDLPCFFYRFDPSVMKLSYSARNWLDMAEVIVAPEDDPQMLVHIHREALHVLAQRARAATHSDRDFILETDILVHGEQVPCQLHCRNIWYADSEELCGTIGLVRRKDRTAFSEELLCPCSERGQK